MFKKFFSLMRRDSDGAAETTKRGGKGAPGSLRTLSNKPNVAARSPEAICQIDPKKMTPEEIRKRLAELFRRHNQAEASLNAELREEARVMLDAIVACRQKYVDKS